MNPEPATAPTSQRPCSSRPASEHAAEGSPRGSASAALWNAPPTPGEAVAGVVAAAVSADGELDACGAREDPESGEGVVRTSVSINAEYHFESDPVTAIANQSSSGTSQQKLQRDQAGISSSSVSTTISVHARDVQAVPSSNSNSDLEPLRRPSIPDAPSSPHTLKHPQSQTLTEPPLKKRRPGLNRRHTLGPESFPEALASLYRAPHPPPSPPSPSLPSPVQHIQEATPPRPSTAHAIATIRNRIREDPGGVTTLKLARGNIGNGSVQRSNILRTMGSMEDKAGVQQSDPESRSTVTGLELLATVGIVELLEQDERPTFIIDVANQASYTPGGPLQIVFANASLRAHETILETITSTADLDRPGVAVTNFHAFKAWALSFVKNNEALNVSLPLYIFEGLSWTCSTLQKRLRIISCTNITTSTVARPGSSNGVLGHLSPFGGDVSRQPSSLSAVSNWGSAPSDGPDYFGEPRKSSITEIAQVQMGSSPDIGDSGLPSPRRQSMLVPPSEGDSVTPGYPGSSSFDWTRIPISAALPRHIQFARSVDWSATPLGPIDKWTFDLRAICNLVMSSPHPAAMFWGPEYISIYNEAYIHLAGQKHPSMMGQSYNLAWAEIWGGVEDAFSNAMKSGQATMKDDDCLFLKRDDRLEETYFSWSIIPLVGEDGSVVGIYNPAFDKTRRKIAERRMLTLREVGERTAAARDLKGFWSQVIKGLEFNEYDVPFMLLYSVHSDVGQCVLEGSLGVPHGHRSAESPLNLQSSDGGFAPYLRASMKSKGAILLTTEDSTLSYDLIEGLEWRGWGDACRAVVVCPIHPTTGDSIVGFLVMGVNPRRPYDDEYSLFIQLLSRQLATSMASVILFEEEISRGQLAARLADLERQELSRQLDLRTQEAVESETKFTRMAEFAPVGMFIANSSGGISYSNDAWWEISRHPREENNADTWMESIHDKDREGVLTVWKKLVEERIPVTHEFRFKTPWQDRNGNRGDTWVLMSAYPERDENEQLKSVFGSITNISQQKWAEDFQKRRMEEAFESKRQQDNFIDMTSHEMRNPLSAILQSADEIGMSLSEFLSTLDESTATQKLTALLDSSVEAAQTISLCAQHQKRIVDDILTLSKLDSALLIVTPVAVQPVAVVQRALRMFEGELDSNDIALEFRVQKTYLDMKIDWVKLDPSRLLQVLINLATNAIKFTSGQDKRNIVVSIGASNARPTTAEANVSYFPSRLQRKDLTADEGEWGSGDNIFLHFTVQDTGRGLDESEKTLLFQRFRQASPRTHVQYGGSGLGLFISRELTELQGGEIGVASERGIGSTFAFYIKARRVEDMPADTPIAATVNSLRRSSSNSTATSFTVENRRQAVGMSVYRSNTKGRRRASAITSPAIPSTSMLDYTKLKALIVEDNLVNQRVLQKQLRNIGLDAEVANHGGEALEILKTSKFWTGRETDGIELAIILMDLEMPVMDGLTCARTIRNLERAGSITKHVPIIAVTANVRLEQIEMAISAGMDDVVSKPFRIPELLPKIEDLISRNATTSWGVLPANSSSPADSPP